MGKIDIQPVLVGNTIRLRPLEECDLEGLYQVASDPEIWKLHPNSERYRREIFEPRYFASALASKGALIIEEKGTGRIIGSSRFYEWMPDTKEVSIGYTFIAREHWGNGTNDELKALMLNHIFQWAQVAWFHVGKINMRSRRAVEKLGATLDHEKERELDGKPFTQLYYKLEASKYYA